MPSKYHNKPTIYKGMRFDSQGECRRYQELELLEKAGEIKSLQRQVSFTLTVNGKKICIYKPDFVYFENGERIVEDFKGVITDVFKLKAKLFEAIFDTPIKITGKRK